MSRSPLPSTIDIDYQVLAISEKGDCLRLTCHIQPGAKRTEIVGQHGNALKIRLAAPPVEGAANSALIEFMAECFALQRKQVSICSGLKSRAKTLELCGLTLAEFKKRLTGN